MKEEAPGKAQSPEPLRVEAEPRLTRLLPFSPGYNDVALATCAMLKEKLQ
jgi:hypothetical protein